MSIRANCTFLLVTCVQVVQPPLMLDARGVSSLRPQNIQISLAAMSVMCGNVSETVMTPFMIYMFWLVESCLIGRKPLKPWPWEPGAYITTQSWRQTASWPSLTGTMQLKKTKSIYNVVKGIKFKNKISFCYDHSVTVFWPDFCQRWAWSSISHAVW